MREYSQEELEDLISCLKRITEPPKEKMVLVNRYLRNGMKLKSVDDNYEFYIFMRQSDSFKEDFSVGLNYRPIDYPEEVYLLRCNSRHGHSENTLTDKPHFIYHIHWINAEDLNSGIRKLKHRKPTDKYGCFEEALIHLMHLAHVENAGAIPYLVDTEKITFRL